MSDAPVARRTLLGTIVAGGAWVAAAHLGLWSRPALARAAGAAVNPYGPLQPTRDRATGLPLLRLPPDFDYVSFGWTGDPLEGGGVTPPRHDGMAVVRAEGSRVWLVRNHEVALGAPFGSPALTYDPHCGGGTTTLTFDTVRGEWEGAWASLAGTSVMCAGGPTPWHTWLACEETVMDAGRPHGFVFEVPAPGAADPTPLPGLGRFVHEATAVDPRTGIVYLTEDRDTAGFYRFVPRVTGVLARGGRLQMLRAGGKATDLGGPVAAGSAFDVDWVDIDDPTRAHSRGTSDTLGVFMQGRRRGGTRFRRLEGCVADGGRILFTSASGGGAGAGQIWEYAPAAERLRLVYESPDRAVLDYPDNVAVGTRGGLLLCQDSIWASTQTLYAYAPGEPPFVFAENAIVLRGEPNGLSGDFRGAEWAGAVFHGRWLFVNVQTPGATFAITGPWERGPL